MLVNANCEKNDAMKFARNWEVYNINNLHSISDDNYYI